MNQDSGGNNPLAKGARMKRRSSPQHPNHRSGSPGRSKDSSGLIQQPNSDVANIPESEPKMVTLLRVSPRDSSVSSGRQSRHRPNKAAWQEKKSQYLEYASQVEERRRQSAQGQRKMMQGDHTRNHSGNGRALQGKNGAGRELVQSNPQLAHRQLPSTQQNRPSRQPPPMKPQRHFSQSPPRRIAREPNKMPNGQQHRGHQMPQQPQSENFALRPNQRHGHRSSSSQPLGNQQTSHQKLQPNKAPVPRQRTQPSNHLKKPQVAPKTSRSPNRPPHQESGKETLEPPTQIKIRAEVHMEPHSNDVASPRHSLPVDSLPSEESILSWFDKNEAQASVSNSYPPAVGRSQSAGPWGRGSASKAELQNDLKNFDKLDMMARKRLSSPDSRYDRLYGDSKTSASDLPMTHERQSRLDRFTKASHIPKAASHASLNQNQKAKASQSRIPVKKGSVDNLRSEALRSRDNKNKTSDPEPPPRQRRSSRHDQAQIPQTSSHAKSKIPSSELHAKSNSNSQHPKQTREKNEPRAPPRLRKGSRETPEPNRVRKSEKHVPVPSETKEKSSGGTQKGSAEQEKSSKSRHSEKTEPVKKSAVLPSKMVTKDRPLDETPKRPKSSSPLNQELRRRLSEIMLEHTSRENARHDVYKKQTSPTGKEKPSSPREGQENPDQEPDVIDRMLNSTMEQDFKGELDRNLAQRKTKLEQSLENEDKEVSTTSKGKTSINTKMLSETEICSKSEVNVTSHDSGLGASYESETNPVKDKTVSEKDEKVDSSRSPENPPAGNETEFIVTEWSDEIDSAQPATEGATQIIKPDDSNGSAPTSGSPPPSSLKDVPSDEVKRKVRLRRWSIASDGERPHVAQRPLSSGGEDEPESTKSSLLSSMKVGISVPDLDKGSTDNLVDDKELSLDDSSGLLNVKEIEEEIEKSSNATSSSVQSTPRRSTPSQGSATPRASSPSMPIEDLEDEVSNSVHSSPRRTTPPHERLIPSVSPQPSYSLDRSHQSFRQMPVKVLPTSPNGEDLMPVFSEDHDMSAMSFARPTTPSQQSKSPTDPNLKKPRYLKLTGMQLLPQKLQLLGSKDKSKGASPPKDNSADEPDGQRPGLYRKNDNRGRDRSKKDFQGAPAPRVKRRSASAEGFFSFQRERSPSPLGLRGFVTPSRHSKTRERRGRQKMLTPPGNHALKMPRQPRPQRMHTILESLKKGLKETIAVSKEKLEVMEKHLHDPQTTSSRQGFHYNLDKQIKVAERYIRKLQFHLAKVEEVHEQYDKELKVREGAVNVVRAYADTNLPHAREPSNEAKAGVRDCTQSLCQMEAELEANLGAFIVRIDGIAGFARVCRGDVFEVVFKYGLQKWKSRCKVEKDLSQSWDVDEIVMYPMLADFLTIKVTEMRGIARSNMVIGNLEFDTSDFYQADPQTLTIDVNENGTIKLNLVVTWSPFYVNEEMYKSPKNSYNRRERAFTESVISTSKSFNSSVSESPKSPKKSLPNPLDLNTSPTLTLEEAMHNVTRLLEILKGQYTELDVLEKQVANLNDLLKKIRDRKKRDSTMSLMVKNALESFDFLNEVEENDGSNAIDSGSGSMDDNRSSITSDEFCKSQSSDRLSDCASLEEPHLARRDSFPSLSTFPAPTTSTPVSSQTLPLTRANRGSRLINMSEKRESRLIEMNEQRERRLVDSPGESYSRCWEEGSENSPKLTTGSDSIDMVLVQHLMYIEYLLSHLGAFGPLKLKETIALQKLKKQAVIIEQLVVLAVSSTPVTRADDVFPELKLNPLLLEFWQFCAEKEALYVNAESFLLQLDVKFGAKLRTSHPDIADDVFQSLCNRIIERPVDLYNPKTIITLFQYIGFFATDDRKHPEKFINDLTKDFELTASLEPSNPDLLKVLKKLPKGSLLSTGNLRALGLLLLEDRATIQMGVRVYLESVGGDEKMRKKAVNVYLECLEERDLSLRQAGCAAIAALKANEALEQLLYLLRCDMDDVKSTAKEALMAFGDEGKQAYEQISYTPYGNYNHDYSEIDVPLMTTEL